MKDEIHKIIEELKDERNWYDLEKISSWCEVVGKELNNEAITEEWKECIFVLQLWVSDLYGDRSLSGEEFAERLTEVLNKIKERV